VTNHEAGDGPPALRLVIENADRDIDIIQAKRQVTRKLAHLAASILRTIAGSGSAAPIMPSVLNLVEAQKQLATLTGDLLPPEEERQALSLVEATLPPEASHTRYREYEYAHGMEILVKGALRLVAHQVLKEREHFGGKYSTRAIEEGIAVVVRATKGPQNRKRNRRKVIL
jgi:hypothetical protein